MSTTKTESAGARTITCRQCGVEMPDDAYARMYGRCARHADDERTTAASESSARHTAGPWQIAEYGVSPDHYAIKRGPYTLAASIPREADARLIAAAPDLLAALEAIVAYDTPLPAGLLDQARAAITAATGGVQ